MTLKTARLFKAVTTVTGRQHIPTPSNFTDWYEGTAEEARACWEEDCHRYGLPKQNTTVTFTECDPVTLKPIHQSKP